MSWRLAKSLDILRQQVNQAWPDRNKASDGTIGDADHRKRTSDHNPWVEPPKGGIVTALDLTHDPIAGADMHALVDTLIDSRDPRIKYVIWNRRIWRSYRNPGQPPAWTPEPYRGPNPHTAHAHISVNPNRSHYDNDAPWTLPGATPDQEDETMKFNEKHGGVERLQRALNAWQAVHGTGGGEPIAEDGYYGPATRGRVKTVAQKIAYPFHDDGGRVDAFFVLALHEDINTHTTRSPA